MIERKMLKGSTFRDSEKSAGRGIFMNLLKIR